MWITSETEQERLQCDPSCMTWRWQGTDMGSRMVAATVKRQGEKGARIRDSGPWTPCVWCCNDGLTSLCIRHTWYPAAVSSSVACGLWAVTICPHRLISCNQCAPLVGDVCMWDEGAWKFLMFSIQHSCEPQTSENSVLKICNYVNYLSLYFTLLIITEVGIFIQRLFCIVI